MSLVAWFPLNGDLHNQGLDNVTLVKSNATFTDNGKTGKCLASNSTATDWTTIPSLVNCKKFSITYWARINTATTTNWLDAVAWYTSSETATNTYNRQEFSYMKTDQSTMNVGVWYAGGSNSNYPVSLYDWHHFAIVIDYENAICAFYVDGFLKNTKTDVNSEHYLTGRLRLFDTNLDISECDVRIYNHCLSEKEVHEISKGLVAHYKLDGDNRGQPNLLKNSNFTEGDDYKQGISFNTSASKQSDCMKVVGTSNTSGFFTSNYDSITTGAVATFSAWVKSDSNMTIYIGVDGNGITDCQSYNIGTSWQQISISKAKTTSNPALRIYGNGTFYVKYMKYELGDTPTTWSPNSADSIYTSLNYNDTTIYDCSGFNYHGSPLGTLTTSSDTARYSLSTGFDGLTSGVLIENLYLASIINSEITYSFWIKPNGENGARSVYFGSYNARSWSIEKNANNVFRLYWDGNPDETCTGVIISDGVWQHLCVTKKGSNDVKVYYNGTLAWTSTKAHNDKAFPTTYRIGRDYRENDGTPYKGQMSDFRIYSTALSAEDVLELYRTGGSVDKSGNFFAYELKEG